MRTAKKPLVLAAGVVLGLAFATGTYGVETLGSPARGFERFKRELQARQEHFRKMYRGDVSQGILFTAKTDSYWGARRRDESILVTFFAAHVCKEEKDDKLLLQRIELLNSEGKIIGVLDVPLEFQSLLAVGKEYEEHAEWRGEWMKLFDSKVAEYIEQQGQMSTSLEVMGYQLEQELRNKWLEDHPGNEEKARADFKQKQYEMGRLWTVVREHAFSYQGGQALGVGNRKPPPAKLWVKTDDVRTIEEGQEKVVVRARAHFIHQGKPVVKEDVASMDILRF